MAEVASLSIVLQLGKALLDLKDKYDQHSYNKNEIKELQFFIQDYDAHIPAIEKRFRQGGGNDTGVLVLKRLEEDLAKAANRLRNWSTSRSFFRVLTSSDRMKKLEHLHKRLMASVQMNLGIASLSTLMDVRDGQATILDSILDSKAELKSVVTKCIRSMAGSLLREVRAEAVQASQASFADQKFWEDVLAAVNQREADAETNFFKDPVTFELMIDPVVASNGHTFCRWTIIDKGMQKDPYSRGEDLTILVDNLLVRSRLFEDFPAQEKQFRERRETFRRNALALASKQLLGDAAVALQHVLQWDKSDKGCAEALLQVQEALKKDHYVSSSEYESDQAVRNFCKWTPGHDTVDEEIRDVSEFVIRESRADAVGGLGGNSGILKEAQSEASSPKTVDGVNRQDHHEDPERTLEEDLHKNRVSWLDPKSGLNVCQKWRTEWTSHGPEYSPSQHDVSSHESGGGARTTFASVSMFRNQHRDSKISSPNLGITTTPIILPSCTFNTEPSLASLVMGVKCAVNVFAKALFLEVIKLPEALERFKRNVHHDMQATVDRANHWKFLVQAFVCKRLFEHFDTVYGFLGINCEHFNHYESFQDCRNFGKGKDKHAIISGLLAQTSADESYLGKFCFRKFKSFCYHLPISIGLPIEVDMMETGRHPQSKFYKQFLEVAVSVWILHSFLHSSERGALRGGKCWGARKSIIRAQDS